LSLNRKKIQSIKDHMPDVKIIISLRNPIYRDWSAAMMHLVGFRMKKREKISIEEMKKELNSRSVRRRGDYIAYLKKWLSVFDRDQVLIILYDDIRDNPKYVLKRIFSHVGVDASVDSQKYPLHKIIHSHPKVPMPDEIHSMLRERYKEDIEELYELLKDKRILNWLDE
ncbi:MAG: sulfotransferase, partial [Candidatus Woesearchaeota archaeon]